MFKPKSSTPKFTIPSDLWPGDAKKMQAGLVQWLSEQASDPIVELGTEVDDPTVSAIQLLVAATRRNSGPPAIPGKIAATALSHLTTPQRMECIAE